MKDGRPSSQKSGRRTRTAVRMAKTGMGTLKKAPSKQKSRNPGVGGGVRASLRRPGQAAFRRDKKLSRLTSSSRQIGALGGKGERPLLGNFAGKLLASRGEREVMSERRSHLL
jgi:hypothetical protein